MYNVLPDISLIYLPAAKRGSHYIGEGSFPSGFITRISHRVILQWLSFASVKPIICAVQPFIEARLLYLLYLSDRSLQHLWTYEKNINTYKKEVSPSLLSISSNINIMLDTLSTIIFTFFPCLTNDMHTIQTFQIDVRWLLKVKQEWMDTSDNFWVVQFPKVK